MENHPKYILVHCSDVSYVTSTDQLKQVNEYHRDVRGFPVSSIKYHVGYHRFITGGKNNQCRLDTDEGAHCNTIVDGVTMNLQSLGICIGFDGDIEMPSVSDVNMLRDQILSWQKQYNIPIEHVMFHRDFDTKGKTCPGTKITRAWLIKLLDTNKSEPTFELSLVQRFIALWLRLFKIN